jgi:hypothetical protein
MRPASKWRPGHAVGLSLSAGFVAFGCLVPDIELVASLPDSVAGATGREGGAGEPGSSSTGGEPTHEAGADAGGAGEPGQGGAHSQSGAGGTAGAGSSAGGASAGTGGSSTSHGSEIPELNACATDTYRVCDDFEDPLSDHWSPGLSGTPASDAPSGEAVLVKDYAFQHQLMLDFTAISVSFWVLLESRTDQRIVSFKQGMHEFGLGMEHDRARFMHSGIEGLVAPSDDNKTRLLAPATWLCLELRVDTFGGSIESRVVVPGDPAFPLPALDNMPTAGEDDEWNAGLPGGWQIESSGLVFGEEGSYQKFDDVLIGEYDQQTLCDIYLEAVGG